MRQKVMKMTREQLLDLKGEIARSGIKQGDLAMRLGVSKSQFSRYLNGWDYMPEAAYCYIKSKAVSTRREIERPKHSNGRKVGPLWATL
jgi:hypothetical protein